MKIKRMIMTSVNSTPKRSQPTSVGDDKNGGGPDDTKKKEEHAPKYRIDSDGQVWKLNGNGIWIQDVKLPPGSDMPTFI
jgi:hypothetical protein